MARIRTYEQQVSTPAAFGRSNVDVGSAGMVGNALTGLGKQISSFGEVMHKADVKQDMTSMNTSLAKVRNDFTLRIQEDAQRGSIDAEKIQSDYQDEINKLTESVSTNEGREYLENQGSMLGSDLVRSASISQAQVAGKRAVEAQRATVEFNSNTLQNSPADFSAVLDESNQAIDAQVQSGVMDVAVGDQLKRMSSNAYAANAMRGWIEIDRPRAKKYLNDGTFDKYLDSDAKSQLKNHIDALDRADVNKAEQIADLKFKDPWEFLNKNGVAPQAVDFTSENSVVDRQLFIQNMDKKFGYLPNEVPFLSPNEAFAMTRVFEQQDARATTSMLRTMAENTPPEVYSGISNQIFKDSPAHGIAMAISKDDADSAEKIIAGKALMKSQEKGGVDKKSMLTPASSEVSAVFDDYLGNSISDPNLRVKIKDAAFAHYVKTRFDDGDNLQILDERNFKESLEKVIGPTATVNDSKIVSFREKSGQFVSSEKLTSRFNNLDPQVIESTQGDVPRLLDGTPVDMKKTEGRLNPVSVGDGRYMLRRESDILLNKNGQPFVLDMKKYMEKYDSEEKPGFWKRLFE